MRFRQKLVYNHQGGSCVSLLVRSTPGMFLFFSPSEMGVGAEYTCLKLVAVISLISAPICSAEKTETKHPLIVVSLDGVGWQFVSVNFTDTPNFDFIAKTGVKAKNMLTVNPTSTFPTHATFGTGLWPESHGIVANEFYDPVYDETFYLENDCTNFDPKFYNDSEPIWLTMEKRGRKTGAYFWPSSTSYDVRPSYFADHVCSVNCSLYHGEELIKLRRKIGRNHCKFDWFNDPYWNRVDTAIKWLKSDEPPELVLLYFEQSDYDGHKYGPNHAKYWRSVETTDRRAIGYLIWQLTQASLLDKVNLIVVSDHSMVETSNTRQIDLYDYVSTSSYHGPGLWVKPDQLESVYQSLKKVPSPHMKVYKREDVPESYHSRHNRRYPPLFVDVDVGWQLRWEWYSRHYEGDWTKGTHWWPPSEETAGLFYARGPSFKEGYNTSKSLRAVDLYPLMCHLLGLEPLPHNGSLDNMKELLRKPEPVLEESWSNDTLRSNATARSHADVVTDNVTLLMASLIMKLVIMF